MPAAVAGLLDANAAWMASYGLQARRGSLVGRKIGDSIWAVYASRTYIERHGQPASIEGLARLALVGFDDSMPKHRIAQWL